MVVSKRVRTAHTAHKYDVRDTSDSDVSSVCQVARLSVSFEESALEDRLPGETAVMAARLSFSTDKQHSDVERWICIYPAYINSRKTRAEGRRISKRKAVENPTHQEIRDVLQAGGFKLGVENKLYPRERSKEFTYIGRIRVQLKNDDGTPVKADYPTRESVFFYIADMIPKLKTRQNRPGEQAAHQQQSSSQAQSSNKTKGKKGRR